MEDSIIVELYLQKNENAIKETDSKYGAYCFTIADNILHNKEDSEECVNDPESVTGLNTEALNALFPVDMMDSCEEMMIQDWHGAPIKRMILRTSASHTTQRLPMFWSTLRAKCLMPI